MSFYDFMIENYINDETPFGDFARDMRDDKEMPENKNNDERIFQYLDFKIRDSLVEEIFEKAKKEYRRNKNMNEIENVSDQLDGYMEEIDNIICKFEKERGLTKNQAIEIAKIAAENIKADVFWKRLKDIKEELETINDNLEDYINS